ncbi:E3 SUMO-protein ligase RanBP2 [Holothuria leucospilota]|uniref:E3 SUMO-protein ligase RanBP2 n=1 Tax=Holothuria leucospilota TaxID=206669 RepID=A0A9Q1H2V4_HOLLE|nr:E3 SUMO-protein ligase RanBP2 [Holothuria leucospilota]
MSVSSSFSFTAPPPHDPESTKSTLPSTTEEQPLSKPTEAVPGQQTITTPKFNFGSGMLQFTFGGTNQEKPSPGLFGSTSASSGATSQAASTSSYSTTNQPGCVFGAVQTTPVFGATTEKGSLSAFKGFVFGTKQSEPRTENKKAISFSDLVKNQGEFSFRLNVDNVASSLSKSGAKSPAKSPVLNNSKKYYQDEERDDIYFEPVVTLPENYKLETGEEDEEVKFSQRAKLYRFDMEGSQWKERGVGNIKVLYNPETKQYRIVMRREQVLRVCANHYITQHVNLQPNKGSERSWVWQAMDSSDGDPQNEQLAVRFKTEDAAREYKEVVDEAKKDLLELTSPQEDERNCDDGAQNKQQVSFSDLVKSEGQFTFRLNVDKVASSLKCTRKSPVKSPVLNKSGEYYHEEERDDTYFEPVVTLPENYKLETGEENEEVKFSQRAKLYRFDIEGSQWKERGVGNIKVLYNPETKQYRIVMRREQVLRVCANHYITQHVNLQPSKGSEKSWVWRAMDSSDGDPQNEQLAVRFKTEDAAREFKDLVDEAKKDLLDKHKGDEEPSRLADEETAKEEKEEKSSMDCMFSAPADLSYADENKDWQLRGKGQFQILFDKDDKNFLVEMRRDKDNSLCAKHLITKTIQLMPVRGQDRSYAWSAVDSSDKKGFPVSMTFAVRFKNRETADNFQEEFQRAQIGPWPGQNSRRAVHNKWYTYR